MEIEGKKVSIIVIQLPSSPYFEPWVSDYASH